MTNNSDKRSTFARQSLKRRTLLLGAGGFGLANLCTPWIRRASAQTGEVVVATWGGSTSELTTKHVFDPFQQETGIKVTVVSPFSYGKLKSMVEASRPEWDVTIMGDISQAKRAMTEGLLEAVDYGVVNGDELYPDARGSHWTAGQYEAVVISYRKDTYPDTHPKGWAEFWDADKYPGSRALHNWCVTTMEAALLADGVDPKSLYPLDIDRAFKSLDRVKPNIKIWWDVGAQGTSQQLLKDHEVDLINMWTGRVGQLMLDGDPVDMDYTQALFTIAPWVVVKGAPNLANGQKLLAYLAKAEPQAALHTELIYGPTNKNAFPLIKPEIARLLPSYPDNLAKTIAIDTDYWQANEGPVTERFTAWLLG